MGGWGDGPAWLRASAQVFLTRRDGHVVEFLSGPRPQGLLENLAVAASSRSSSWRSARTSSRPYGLLHAMHAVIGVAQATCEVGGQAGEEEVH